MIESDLFSYSTGGAATARLPTCDDIMAEIRAMRETIRGTKETREKSSREPDCFICLPEVYKRLQEEFPSPKPEDGGALQIHPSRYGLGSLITSIAGVGVFVVRDMTEARVLAMQLRWAGKRPAILN